MSYQIQSTFFFCTSHCHRPVQSWWKTCNSSSAMQPSLASSPSASSGTERARSDKFILNTAICTSGKSLGMWSNVTSISILDFLHSSFPLEISEKHDLWNISYKQERFPLPCWKITAHQPVPFKYEHSPPESNQALSVHPQTSCQGQILTEGKAPLEQTESDKGFLYLTVSLKKCIKFPEFQTCCSIRTSTQTQGQSRQILESFSSDLLGNRLLKLLELCLSLPIQMLSSALKTSWIH